MADTNWVSESIDQLQAMRRDIERQFQAARDAEAARKASDTPQVQTQGPPPKGGK